MDYQMSAWLMAICLNGMDEEETAALTEAMVQSGDVMDWPKHEIGGEELPHKVDKHSTGGVGDKVSLILAPLVASFGLLVPMMAGRGLGHTGGTIDKLESIPGFRTQYSADEFANLLLSDSDNGPLNGAIVSPSSNICPADKRMYALRDVTATVTSIALQTSSIMSKKIAERPDSLVLDVKFGKGSFNNEVEASLELAKSMIQAGELCGIRTSALVTRMDNVMGCAVGNWLEVKECINIMTMGASGKTPECISRSKDLIEITLTLAAQMLVQAKKAATLQEGIAMAQDHLLSGKCWKKFREMVQAQGGSLRCIESPEDYPKAKYSAKVISPKKGFITSIDALEIGLVGVLIGAGRKSIDESVDFSAGIWFHIRPGQSVENGQVLATIYTERNTVLANATKSVIDAFSFSEKEVTTPPLIASIVTKDGVREFDHSLLESIKFD